MFIYLFIFLCLAGEHKNQKKSHCLIHIEEKDYREAFNC
jgi:hypothetical protein